MRLYSSRIGSDLWVCGIEEYIFWKNRGNIAYIEELVPFAIDRLTFSHQDKEAHIGSNALKILNLFRVCYNLGRHRRDKEYPGSYIMEGRQ